MDQARDEALAVLRHRIAMLRSAEARCRAEMEQQGGITAAERQYLRYIAALAAELEEAAAGIERASRDDTGIS